MDNLKTKITVITTGGTIEKTYSEYDGTLKNRESSIKKAILEGLRLPYTELEVYSILAKDSLDMSDEDRSFLTISLKHHLEHSSPIVVLHGTDTMSDSAEYCLDKIGVPRVPVIFTGAMKPLGFADSDAKQNVTEALLAAKILEPGFYISFHNKIFKVPGVKKNKDKRTFENVD